MLLRIVADLIIIACLGALGVMTKAWAAEVTSGVGVALINNLAPILTVVVALVTALSTLLAIILKKVNTVHDLVNSQFSEAKAEIKGAKDEIVALKAVIADKPGATSEEKVRALVAQEQQTRVELPKEKKV